MPATRQLRDDLRVEPCIALRRVRALGPGPTPEILGLEGQCQVVGNAIGRHVLEVQVAAHQEGTRPAGRQLRALGESRRSRVPGGRAAAEEQVGILAAPFQPQSAPPR